MTNRVLIAMCAGFDLTTPAVGVRTLNHYITAPAQIDESMRK